MILELGFLENYGLLALRLAAGAIFVYHGLPKLKNLKGTSQGMKMPLWFVTLIALAEVLGGIALMLGFLTEIAALGLALEMLGAIYLKASKWKVPFSSMQMMGWEFDLTLVAMMLALLVLGAGGISVDALMGLYP